MKNSGKKLITKVFLTWALLWYGLFCPNSMLAQEVLEPQCPSPTLDYGPPQAPIPDQREIIGSLQIQSKNCPQYQPRISEKEFQNYMGLFFMASLINAAIDLGNEEMTSELKKGIENSKYKSVENFIDHVEQTRSKLLTIEKEAGGDPRELDMALTLIEKRGIVGVKRNLKNLDGFKKETQDDEVRFKKYIEDEEYFEQVNKHLPEKQVELFAYLRENLNKALEQNELAVTSLKYLKERDDYEERKNKKPLTFKYKPGHPLNPVEWELYQNVTKAQKIKGDRKDKLIERFKLKAKQGGLPEDQIERTIQKVIIYQEPEFPNGAHYAVTVAEGLRKEITSFLKDTDETTPQFSELQNHIKKYLRIKQTLARDISKPAIKSEMLPHLSGMVAGSYENLRDLEALGDIAAHIVGGISVASAGVSFVVSYALIVPAYTIAQALDGSETGNFWAALGRNYYDGLLVGGVLACGVLSFPKVATGIMTGMAAYDAVDSFSDERYYQGSLSSLATLIGLGLLTKSLSVKDNIKLEAPSYDPLGDFYAGLETRPVPGSGPGPSSSSPPSFPSGTSATAVATRPTVRAKVRPSRTNPHAAKMSPADIVIPDSYPAPIAELPPVAPQLLEVPLLHTDTDIVTRPELYPGLTEEDIKDLGKKKIVIIRWNPDRTQIERIYTVDEDQLSNHQLTTMEEILDGTSSLSFSSNEEDIIAAYKSAIRSAQLTDGDFNAVLRALLAQHLLRTLGVLEKEETIDRKRALELQGIHKMRQRNGESIESLNIRKGLALRGWLEKLKPGLDHESKKLAIRAILKSGLAGPFHEDRTENLYEARTVTAEPRMITYVVLDPKTGDYLDHVTLPEGRTPKEPFSIAIPTSRIAPFIKENEGEKESTAGVERIYRQYADQVRESLSNLKTRIEGMQKDLQKCCSFDPDLISLEFPLMVAAINNLEDVDLRSKLLILMPQILKLSNSALDPNSPTRAIDTAKLSGIYGIIFHRLMREHEVETLAHGAPNRHKEMNVAFDQLVYSILADLQGEPSLMSPEQRIWNAVQILAEAPRPQEADLLEFLYDAFLYRPSGSKSDSEAQRVKARRHNAFLLSQGLPENRAEVKKALYYLLKRGLEERKAWEDYRLGKKGQSENPVFNENPNLIVIELSKVKELAEKHLGIDSVAKYLRILSNGISDIATLLKPDITLFHKNYKRFYFATTESGPEVEKRILERVQRYAANGLKQLSKEILEQDPTASAPFGNDPKVIEEFVASSIRIGVGTRIGEAQMDARRRAEGLTFPEGYSSYQEELLKARKELVEYWTGLGSSMAPEIWQDLITVVRRNKGVDKDINLELSVLMKKDNTKLFQIFFRPQRNKLRGLLDKYLMWLEIADLLPLHPSKAAAAASVDVRNEIDQLIKKVEQVESSDQSIDRADLAKIADYLQPNMEFQELKFIVSVHQGKYATLLTADAVGLGSKGIISKDEWVAGGAPVEKFTLALHNADIKWRQLQQDFLEKMKLATGQTDLPYFVSGDDILMALPKLNDEQREAVDKIIQDFHDQNQLIIGEQEIAHDDPHGTEQTIDHAQSGVVGDKTKNIHKLKRKRALIKRRLLDLIDRIEQMEVENASWQDLFGSIYTEGQAIKGLARTREKINEASKKIKEEAKRLGFPTDKIEKILELLFEKARNDFSLKNYQEIIDSPFNSWPPEDLEKWKASLDQKKADIDAQYDSFFIELEEFITEYTPPS